MATYKEKLDELRRSAEDKVREFDEKFKVRERFEESARNVQRNAENLSANLTGNLSGNLREGADRIFAEAERLRHEAERLASDAEISEHARRVASDAARKAREVTENLSANINAEDLAANLRENADALGKQASEFARENFGASGEKAGEVINNAKTRAEEFFGGARDRVQSAARKTADAFNFGLGWTRIVQNSISGAGKAFNWAQEKPLQAVGTGFSILLGLRLGSAMPFSSSNWIPNSALPVWGLKKASEQFEKYLKNQEELIKNGELSEAETRRVEFERDIAKYVGAPLLGAFSCAAGAAMWWNIFQPGRITGAPISWLLGGNPILDGIWLFGNGLICFKIGADFFMIALEDQSEVQRIVREIKGLLPKPQEA